MLDKPDLSDDQIMQCLRVAYGLDASAIDFLPLGYDSNAGVYRVSAGGTDYFVKAKRDEVDPVRVLLPRYLHENGLPEAVAPIAPTDGSMWGSAGGYSILVYPFIEESELELLPDELRVAYGAILRRLHAIQLPADLLAQVRCEDFIPHPTRRAAAEKTQTEVQQRMYSHPIEQETAAYWRAHRAEIDMIIARAASLGDQLRAQNQEFVLCHSDIHQWNLLVDRSGGLHIVDWDQPILAPRECDLMFITLGGFVSDPQVEALYFEGYGQTGLDRAILAFYRYERTMEDIAEFGETIFSPENSDETKADALRWLKIQFEPGGMVEAAKAADDSAR